MLILCIWLQVINKVKVTHQGEGHIKVKVKYLHFFKFYVTHTLCKRVVCIRLKCVLVYTAGRVVGPVSQAHSSVLHIAGRVVGPLCQTHPSVLHIVGRVVGPVSQTHPSVLHIVGRVVGPLSEAHPPVLPHHPVRG